MLVADERIRLQHVVDAVGPLPDVVKLLEVIGDLALVPGGEDRVDVGEVLVERRAADSGPLCDLGHRDTGQAAYGDQTGCRVEDRFPHRVAVGRDGVVPQLRHSWILARRSAYHGDTVSRKRRSKCLLCKRTSAHHAPSGT